MDQPPRFPKSVPLLLPLPLLLGVFLLQIPFLAAGLRILPLGPLILAAGFLAATAVVAIYAARKGRVSSSTLLLVVLPLAMGNLLPASYAGVIADTPPGALPPFLEEMNRLLLSNAWLITTQLCLGTFSLLSILRFAGPREPPHT